MLCLATNGRIQEVHIISLMDAYSNALTYQEQGPSKKSHKELHIHYIHTADLLQVFHSQSSGTATSSCFHLLQNTICIVW